MQNIFIVAALQNLYTITNSDHFVQIICCIGATFVKQDGVCFGDLGLVFSSDVNLNTSTKR